MAVKKLTEVVESTVYFVDFKSRTLTSSKTESFNLPKSKTKKSKKLDMSGFNPPQGNFEYFSDEELTENSNHILKHLQELSVDDLVHFVSVGSLDKKKLAKKLKLQGE